MILLGMMALMVGEFHLRMFERISALIEPDIDPPVIMFITSTHFAAVYEELLEKLKNATVLPTPDNFKELLVGNNLRVVNSGSEDQGAVNLANRIEAERAYFTYRRDNFRIG